MYSLDRKCDSLRCGVKVDLGAIRSNLLAMKALARDKLIMTVIKADAYGHGAIKVSKMLEDISDMFAVATVDEGVKLRNKARIKKPILILGPVFENCFDVIIAHDLTQTVFDEDSVVKLNNFARRVEKGEVKAKVHIAVDTGMSRIGLSPDETGLLTLKKILRLSNIQVEGIFTHFATADSKDKTNVNEALKKFLDFKNLCVSANIHIPIWHSANSASVIDGIALGKEMDMVRCGISIYGIYPSDEVQKENIKLKYPMEWYSFVTRISKIKPGTSISYGYTFTADKEMTIATVCCGYGDGYPRLLSNIGDVLLSGKRCPILGRICMDQFMIDVSKIPEAKVGDLVILMGSDGEETITPEEIAEKCGTIGYEIVCGISSRVPRVYAN